MIGQFYPDIGQRGNPAGTGIENLSDSTGFKEDTYFERRIDYFRYIYQIGLL